MVGAVQNNYLAIGGYYPRANVYGTQQGPVPPVTPVSPADPVVGRETAPISAPMPRPRLPEIRQGADPVEMSVRGRIQYLDPEQVDRLARGEALEAPGESSGAQQAKSPQDVMDEAQCETCENRKYQDGSDDPGVSFKTPSKIDPDQAAAVVRGHEMEHVVREQAKAEREDRKVVSQSVTLHNSICPDCGRTYISGGTTRTTTKADPAAELQNQLTQQAKQAFGMDAAA